MADAFLEARARVGAFWLAWRYVLVLLVLLALSLWGNLHQYVASKTAPLRADLKQATDTLDTVRGLAQDAKRDHAGLVVDLESISARGKAWMNTANAIGARHPLPAGCGPGRERVDWVNKDADP